MITLFKKKLWVFNIWGAQGLSLALEGVGALTSGTRIHVHVEWLCLAGARCSPRLQGPTWASLPRSLRLSCSLKNARTGLTSAHSDWSRKPPEGSWSCRVLIPGAASREGARLRPPLGWPTCLLTLALCLYAYLCACAGRRAGSSCFILEARKSTSTKVTIFTTASHVHSRS